MNETLTQLTQQLTSRLAAWLIPMLSALIATAIGSAVAKAALYAPWLDLSAVDALAIGAGVAGVLVSIAVGTFNALTNKLLKQGTAQVQATLNEALKLPDIPKGTVSVDGVAGVNTNTAAQVVVNALINALGKKP